MSGPHQHPPSDVPPGAGEGELSEEEMRALAAQLRHADAAEVVAQAFSMLIQGAQFKLGRRDGRMLIDLAASIAESAGDRIDPRLRQQMDQALGQLRVAQVDAEKQLDQMRAEGKLPDEEEGDLPRDGGHAVASDETQDRPGAAAPQQDQPSPAGSRLWVPGR